MSDNSQPGKVKETATIYKANASHGFLLICLPNQEQVAIGFSSRSTYSEEVFWTHGSQLGKGLDGEDGREEVVALLQQVPKEWGPVVKALLLEIPSLGNSDEI